MEGKLSIRYTVDPMSPRLPSIPRRGQQHPFDSRLKCYKSSTNFGSNGQAVVEAQYIGLMQDPTYAETETSASTSTQNIQLHPAFPQMAFIDPPSDKNKMVPTWKPYVKFQNDDGVNFEKFRVDTAPPGLRGVESYYAARSTVKVTFYTANFNTAQDMLTSVGTIKDTPYLANGPLPKGCTFLLTQASVSTYGTIYKISCDWMGSEQGEKWSELVYRKFGTSNPDEPKYTIGGNYTVGATWKL